MADNFAGVLAERGAGARLVSASDGPQWAAGDGIARASAMWGAIGLEPGSPVVIACDLTPVTTLAYLGAIHAGLVAVPLDVAELSRRFGLVAAATRASAVWLPNENRSTDAGDATVLVGDAAFEEPTGAAVSRRDDDLAALMLTSGSTGTPRLVMVTHGNLLANTAAIARSQRLGPDDRAMLVLPVSYCFGASVLCSHLYVGADVVLDGRFMFPDKVLRAIAEHGCTTFAGVPTVFRILDRRSSIREIELPSLRRFLQAGGPLDEETIGRLRSAQPNAAFYVMYGQTEATARITTRDAEADPQRDGCVGRPLDGLSLRIVDGEVRVRGPSVCPGYWRDDDATDAKLAGGWLRTGDLGRIDDDGRLWIEARVGQFAKIRGVRVSFDEVEHLARGAAGIAGVAAAATPHGESGEALVLHVVPSPDADRDEVERAVRDRLPATWDIARVEMADELPRTSSGKIDRARLAGGRS